MQQNKQIQNSMLVEVTAYIELAVNGTWKVVGFEPDTLEPVADTVPDTKQTQLGYQKRSFLNEEEEREYKEWASKERTPVQDLLDKAKQVRTKRKVDWSNTKRKIQQCAYCAFHGLNSGYGANVRTCNRDGTHRVAIPRRTW